VPNSPQTVFRLGSVTKQFTAMAIMMLAERGKLNVNDPACKYVTDCLAAWQPITIKNLLTHTAGVPKYTGFPDFAKTAVLPTGKWTLTTVPAEQAQRDVDVFSVTTEADKGLSITKVGVRNRSHKTVSGLKLGWRVVTLDDKLKVLASDDTPLLDVAIPPGESRAIEYAVANFAEVSRSFLRQGELFGDFQIEISVVQVIYGDYRRPVSLTSAVIPLRSSCPPSVIF